MLTNKITGFSADLLNTVRGILGEAKKCPADCECEKCEAEEMKEGSMPTADEPTDANKKTADKVRAMMAKEKKLKEDIMEMVNEASDGLADKAKKSGVSLSTLKKVYARGIAAWNSGHRPGTTPQQWAHARVNSYITKGKGTYHGADKDLRSEDTDMPFEGPYKKVGDRKDEYGNKVKNVAKFLAKKAMNKQKNEEIDPDLEAELKATRVTKKSIADSQKTRERASRMKEDSEHTNCGTPECCGECDTPEQIDEISAKIAVSAYAKRNAKAFNDGQYDDEAEKDYNKLDKQGDRIKRKFGAKIVQKAQKAASKKIFGEGHEEDAGWYTHSQMHGSKKSEKHPKGISADEWKSGIRWHHGKNKRINIKEEVEELDEISKATMGRYINKAKDSIDIVSYRQGHKEAHGSSAAGAEKKLTKRHKGIETAVKKLTKEEQDFVDSLNNEMFEGMDNDMPKGLEDRSPRGRARNAMGRAISRKERNLARARKEIASRNEETGYLETDLKKRKKNNDQAVKDMKKMGSPMKNPHFGEEVEITEARGRPRKAGAKDFTIHPKTKEKLMHNNPADMKRIELLQKNRVLDKPKVEAGQHIMNQLRKAKTSMLGGSKINFTHGDSKEVSGPHAAKILTKYAGMKPDEKETFQKFVGHSHENLMKHV